MPKRRIDQTTGKPQLTDRVFQHQAAITGALPQRTGYIF